MKKTGILILIAASAWVLYSCNGDSTLTTAPGQTEVNKITYNGGGFSNVTVSSIFTFAAYL